jgi:hypothetical protein
MFMKLLKYNFGIEGINNLNCQWKEEMDINLMKIMITIFIIVVWGLIN